ncbi:ABC transporter permease [uncultured Paraglaciecola sp.]|uniref:ABC transporter permease n=1 Tax=uncultured Paraglaciecola sp. TaxID=1765024 RepID=UPI0025F93BEE|nr:ABC transporter permease [uncultured Paraglaciecola sp.]
MNLHLFVNEMRLQWYEMRQYWFETFSGLIFITCLFLGLFYGIKGFALEQGDGQSLDGLLFGFLLWTFASGAYGSVTKSVIEDTQKGYIEQLFLCPNGFISLMLSRSLSESFVGLVLLTAIAYVVMAITGNWLDINLAYFYGILLLSAPSLVGFGLMISGLALLFKRVETIGAFLTLGLMGLVALDGLPLNVFSFLPFVPGASLARDIVLEQSPLRLDHLMIVIANSFVYLVGGIFVFRAFEKQAKKRNLIGQY